MRPSPIAAITVALALLCAGCGLRPLVGAGDGGPGASPTPSAQAPPNTAPQLSRAAVVAAGPGRPATVLLSIRDDEHDAVTVRATHPEGLTADRGDDGYWRLRWSPLETGTVIGRLILSDDRGAVRVESVSLRSTNQLSEDTLLGLGDSVASGHGLQKRDYIGRDSCWRSEKEAYPWHVYQGLVEGGGFRDSGDYALVACSGSTLADLLDEPVGGGPAEALPPDRSKLTQVDWAIAVNPEVVTLTSGANTLGFTDPWELLDPASQVDEAELRRRRNRVEADLGAALDRLVEHTDSLILLTNYYNPAAAEPQGVDGCGSNCFRARTEEVVGAFNDSIAEVAAVYPSDRVVLVDLHELFAGHGAPNGLGPDGLRAGFGGWVNDLLGAPLEGVHPYCARGHDDAGSWVNYLDCVHPDGRGHREIAAAVLSASAMTRSG